MRLDDRDYEDLLNDFDRKIDERLGEQRSLHHEIETWRNAVVSLSAELTETQARVKCLELGKQESRDAYKAAAGPNRENVDKEAEAFAQRVAEMQQEDASGS